MLTGLVDLIDADFFPAKQLLTHHKAKRDMLKLPGNRPIAVLLRPKFVPRLLTFCRLEEGTGREYSWMPNGKNTFVL
jgi:hypothetical protein